MIALPVLVSLALAASGFGLLPRALVGPGQTEADKGGPPPEAVEAFFKGRELYADAKYEEALEAFLEADRLHPAPDLQYNIGLCHMRLEHWEDAIAAFEIYLRTKENPPDRADVEARISEAKRRLKEREGPAPQPKVDPATTTTPEPAPKDEPPPAGKPYRPLVISGAVLLGLGAAGAIAGSSAIGFVVNDKNDELDEIANQGNPREVEYADAVQTEEDARRLVTFQWVSIGVGAGVAVVGAVLLGIGLKRRSDARAGKAAILPWGDGRGGGLAVRGNF